MRKGQPFFSIAMPHPVHRKMARMLEAFGRDGEHARSRWELTCAVLGKEKASSLGWTRAKHLTERIIGAGEKHRFIRRLPSLAFVKLPSEDPRRHGELSYVITEDGLAFRDRQLRYERWLETGVKGSDEKWRRRKTAQMRIGM